MITGHPDPLVTKSVNSWFHRELDLHGWLRAQDLTGTVLAGITTNHCCETTARVGANLGHQVVVALDATHTFDCRSPDGALVTADELTRITETDLHGEFATLANTHHLVPRG